MTKCVIIVRGDTTGKNLFQDIVKKHYWIWNISTTNLIGEVAKLMGWDGNRNQSYNEFLEKATDLGDNYFDFRYWYISNYRQKLFESDKAEKNNMIGDLMVIHGCDDFLSKRLQDEFDIYEFILNKKEYANHENGFSFCYTDENFEDKVLDKLKELSINIKQGEKIDVTI